LFVASPVIERKPTKILTGEYSFTEMFIVDIVVDVDVTFVELRTLALKENTASFRQFLQ